MKQFIIVTILILFFGCNNRKSAIEETKTQPYQKIESQESKTISPRDLSGYGEYRWGEIFDSITSDLKSKNIDFNAEETKDHNTSKLITSSIFTINDRNYCFIKDFWFYKDSLSRVVISRSDTILINSRRKEVDTMYYIFRKNLIDKYGQPDKVDTIKTNEKMPFYLTSWELKYTDIYLTRICSYYNLDDLKKMSYIIIPEMIILKYESKYFMNKKRKDKIKSTNDQF